MLSQRPTAELLPADRGNLTPRAAGPLPGATALDGRKPARAEDLPTYRVTRSFNLGDSPEQTPVGALVMTGEIPDAALARLIEVGAVVDEALLAAEAAAVQAQNGLDDVEGLRAFFDLESGPFARAELQSELPDARAGVADALAKLEAERARVAGNLARLRAKTNKE